ncbi:RND superfamily putative drug exporter [Nocardia tenerifensis]|uniref:RND superfamily putative drug exporter n=1 Tax=Nocardia tenerifensis TaxID=228006 RepID=A0A318JY54_9NOCA|nr:MMPL family transporter [Nocardia tenerifensis]PXX62487.1 RND superfamily putative drug exporter [Nocardia tenerifensis]
MARSTILERPEPPAPTRRWGVAGRWGVAMARHRGVVLGIWLLLVLVCGAAYPALHGRLGTPDYSVPGTDSVAVDELVAQHFSRFGIERDLIVFHSAEGTVDNAQYRATIDRAIGIARQTGGIAGAIGPFDGNAAQISADRHTAFGIVGVDGDISERVRVVQELRSAIETERGADTQVMLTGYAPIQTEMMQIETGDLQRAEALGVPVATVLLILALGAVTAALLPITVTAAGIAVAVGALFGLTTFLAFDSLVLSVATMIATGTAIDYAMFIVSRFNEELTRRGVRDRKERSAIHEAVGAAMDTTGRTVLASGLIVMISLCSLAVVGLPMLNGIAVGVVTAVVATMTAAFTLLPALLATLGPAVNRGALPERLRPAEVRSTTASSAWARWAHTVMARPVLFGAVGVALLLVAAAPLTGLRYGVDVGTDALADRPAGHAIALVEQNFTPGLLAPIEVVATGANAQPLTSDARVEADRFLGELSHDPRIATVLPQYAEGRMFAAVVPHAEFGSSAATDLVTDMRSRAATLNDAEVRVGGTTALFADVSQRITGRFPWVIALVLAVSLVFLIVAFRSIVLAVKAILLNLLATGAALGITVAVFQHGIGESVLDFHSTGSLQIYLPMLVFAVLFGLSMDYEVFLIRRMKEHWDTHGDNAAAVADGLQRTARPITAAAAIMVAVFASFVTANVLELKQIGFALAVAIAIDAVLVRLVLVPALMRLFGRWNWWLPKTRVPNRVNGT